MRRIITTVIVLIGIAAVAGGGVDSALNDPAGPAAIGRLLASAAVGATALGLAARILFVLEQARMAARNTHPLEGV